MTPCAPINRSQLWCDCAGATDAISRAPRPPARVTMPAAPRWPGRACQPRCDGSMRSRSREWWGGSQPARVTRRQLQKRVQRLPSYATQQR